MITDFGNRSQNGDVKTITNKQEGAGFPAITNREFTEVIDYVMNNATDGASDVVYNHLIALFGAVPIKKIHPDYPNFCTLVIIPTGPYNKTVFTSHINQAIQFGYTVVEQDSPLRNWKIYYMSLGNNTYCVTYSVTYRRITVSSRL